MPADPAVLVEALDNAARRIETPCGDGAMVWRVWGEGKPLVLLHGGSGSWKHWLRNVKHFSAFRRVIAADMPGYGDSAEPAAPYTFASLGQIIGGGLDTVLGGEKNYDIMGFSLGSFMAPWAIKACHARADSLTLVHGHLVGVMQYSPQNRLRRWRGVADPVERDAILRGNLGALMLANPEAADDLTLLVYRGDVEQARLRVPVFIDTLDTSILKTLDLKLHVISGQEDPTATPDVSGQQALLRELRPDASMHIVPGAGHWVMWEAADAFHAIADGIL